MGIQAGLVGLPNVGKSTLFNALTKSSIPAANYPFCTIDPHVAITKVPDQRLEKLQKIYKSAQKIPATVTFVDIAGLVKGAAQGEGLGNQFLSHIREVDLILHVLRCFEDPRIIHTETTINPLSDYETINAELMLKDLESVQKRLEKIPKQLKAASNQIEKKELEAEQQLLQHLLNALNHSDMKRIHSLIEKAPIRTIPLLSVKKFLIIANIAEDEINSYSTNPHYQVLVKKFGESLVIPVSVKLAYELSNMDPDEAVEMRSMLDTKEDCIEKIIEKTYEHLGLITFFTCGPQEIHAWPITKETAIRQAAGEIHSDLEKGFICAEVFNCKDLFEVGNLADLKDKGKIRTEGQSYIVQDGDIILVRFNV